MNKEELLRKILSLNIHPKYFSVGVEIKDNAYNIERYHDGRYAVYYLERGEKNGLKLFDTEEEALQQLMKGLEANLKYGLNLSE